MRKYLLLPLFCLLTISVYSQIEEDRASMVPRITLTNGVEMPILGFGTLYLKDSVGIASVEEAIAIGYRLIDTGTIYGNEEAVGKGIQRCGVKRDELFVTTKIWVDDMGYESTKKAFELSLTKLGLDYIDLYLIHRPRGDIQGTWRAMEDLYEEGKIRAIGVSNFEPQQLADLIEIATVKPVINQVESNPFFQQHDLEKALAGLDVQMEAWSPFAQGRNELFDNEVLTAIAQKHHKSVAQITLRWLVQRGIVAIPRTSDRAHMLENISVFDFELDDLDMEQIATLDLNTSQFPEWN